MSDTVWILVAVAVFIAVIMGIGFMVRTGSNAITPISVNEVKPGIFCALATTEAGVGIDCWKEQ